MSNPTEFGWLPPSLLRSRIDANFNRATAIQARARIAKIGEIKDFSEVCTELVCGPFGSTILASDFDTAGDVVWVRPTEISGNLFSDKGQSRITDSMRISRGLKLYDAETMVFARVGIYPHCGVLPSSIRKATISSAIIAAVVDKEQCDPYFLMSFFRTQAGQVILFSIQKVTVQPVIGTEELGSAAVPCPDRSLQRAIGNKLRLAERLIALADANTSNAVDKINSLFSVASLASLAPNVDGSCDYFANFVDCREIGVFHGSQFYSPKRQLAVDAVHNTGCAERIGKHGCRVRAKGKRIAARAHVDPANVDSANGYWSAGGGDEGGDVALAKPDHVLFLRMRPYLNKITINCTESSVSASPEFLIYEFEGNDAYYAALCLRQPWALAQVAEIATGDRPRVDGEFVDDVIIPWPESATRDEISKLYKSSFSLRSHADQLVLQAINDVERLLDGTFDLAKCVEEFKRVANAFDLEGTI